MRMGFARLDDALIDDCVQPVSDFMTHRLGLGRAVTACACIDVAASCWIVSRADGLSQSVDPWRALSDLGLLLLGLVAMFCLRMLLRRVGREPANPLRLIMRPHRAVILLMLLARLTQLQSPGLAEAGDLVMLSCAAIALYLGACRPTPPLRRQEAAHGMRGLTPDRRAV